MFAKCSNLGDGLAAFPGASVCSSRRRSRRAGSLRDRIGLRLNGPQTFARFRDARVNLIDDFPLGTERFKSTRHGYLSHDWSSRAPPPDGCESSRGSGSLASSGPSRKKRVPGGLQSRYLALKGGQCLRVVADGERVVQAVVIVPSAGHVRGARTVVFAGLPIDPLPLVAPVIDPLIPPASRQLLVCSVRPPLARLLDPGPSVKRAALRRAAAFGMLRVGALEPLVTRSLDAVVLAFGEHQVRVRIVLLAVLVAAGVNRERVWKMPPRLSARARIHAPARSGPRRRDSRGSAKSALT